MSVTKDKITLNVIYVVSIRWWLTAMLIFIPFITKIYQMIGPWNTKWASLINRIDELTIVALFPLAIAEFYRDYKIKGKTEMLLLILAFPITLLCISGYISGTLNANTISITALGTFAYIKYFLVIFIYAAFLKDFNMFLKIFRFLLIIAVCIGLTGFLQEMWVIIGRYILAEDSTANGIYMFVGKLLNVNVSSISGRGLRLGIYRASSLLSHYNLLGLYSLFILTIYLHLVKKVNVVAVLSLLAGIFASVSRVAFTGFVLLGGLHIFRGRKWLVIFLIPVITALLFMHVFDDVDMSAMNNEDSEVAYQESVTYRQFARNKALEVWKDHPLWGVGPGMFGGSVAFKNRSSLYEEYNFTYILKWFHSLDQLWPQVLAEMGIVGTSALASLFIAILFVLYILRRNAATGAIKNFFSGLLIFNIIFLIYTLSGNLNIVSILFPFCAFLGMGLGFEGGFESVKKS